MTPSMPYRAANHRAVHNGTTHIFPICSGFHKQIVYFFTIFSFTGRALQFVTSFTMFRTSGWAPSCTMAHMQTRLSLSSVPPDAYRHLIPLVPDEPWALFARAVLAGKPGVYADRPLRPGALAVETATPEGR